MLNAYDTTCCQPDIRLRVQIHNGGRTHIKNHPIGIAEEGSGEGGDATARVCQHHTRHALHVPH